MSGGAASLGDMTDFVSTGQLPAAPRVARLVDGVYERYRANTDGERSTVYPVLANASPDRFGICVAGTDGSVFTAGDADVEFAIMSVSKPFVFALVSQALGHEEARRKLGVNGTGRSFNSLSAVESGDGLTNAMVNPGAIAATSLVPGSTAAEKWDAIHRCLCGFAGRTLSVNEDVYRSASDTNHTSIPSLSSGAAISAAMPESPTPVMKILVGPVSAGSTAKLRTIPSAVSHCSGSSLIRRSIFRLSTACIRTASSKAGIGSVVMTVLLPRKCRAFSSLRDEHDSVCGAVARVFVPRSLYYSYYSAVNGKRAISLALFIAWVNAR